MEARHNGSFDRVAEWRLPAPVPARSDEIYTLTQHVTYLLSHDHDVLPDARDLRTSLQKQVKHVLDKAFRDNDMGALLDVQKSLYVIYEAKFSNPLSIPASHEHSAWLVGARSRIECTWLDWEIEQIASRLPAEKVSRQPSALCEWFVSQAKDLSDVDKSVARYLAEEAVEKEFMQFILADSHLNYRFYDALVLAATHYSEEVKTEISHHFWDECGGGEEKKAHTWQYSRTLQKMGLAEPLIPIWDDWRPYAGFNLYFCLGLNRRHYFKSLGSLAMPELFDPERDKAVVMGLQRLGFEAQEQFEYFYNHMVEDLDHGNQWLDHVVANVVRKQPEAGRDLAIGALLRMQAMNRYNQYLGKLFNFNNQAAQTADMIVTE